MLCKSFDLPKNLSADLADGSAQCANGLRRVPVGDEREISMLEVAIHFKAAPGLQHIADAAGRCPAEGGSYAGFIILCQGRTVNDSEQNTAEVWACKTLFS